jgi:hypothetical protein
MLQNAKPNVLLIIRYFDIAKFVTLTSLSVLISCKFLFLIVYFKVGLNNFFLSLPLPLVTH